MKKVLSILLTICLFAVSACAFAETAADMKGSIAIIVPGATDDGAFNQKGMEGASEAAKEKGVQFKCVSTQGIAEDKFADTLRSLAKEGWQTIICHGSQYGDAVKAVAPEFPDTYFIYSVGMENFGMPNVSSVNVDYKSAGYAAGVIAGMYSENKHIAMITGNLLDAQALMSAGFEAGAHSVDNAIKVETIDIGDFSNADAAEKATLELAGNGVDVVLSCLDAGGAGVAKAAKAKNVQMIGTAVDYAKEFDADGVTLASITYEWQKLAKMEASGQFEPGDEYIVKDIMECHVALRLFA